MARTIALFFVLFLFFDNVICNSVDNILCFDGFCRSYSITTGCSAPNPYCEINNATHQGMWLPSPTPCNCCEYCLPFYGEDEHCSLGGPGTGTTIGRCGPGLTCTQDADGNNHCKRMDTDCHKAQDDYDNRHSLGQVGALEQRPLCDDKGNYEVFDCVPTQTCFCQSDEGERIFGEVQNLGSVTHQNMRCGCSRLSESIKKNIDVGVPHPVIGPRCTFDGNFNPVQCVNSTCYCVDKFTGEIRGNEKISLDTHPITELSCYDSNLDLYPEQSRGAAPYNFTTSCYEEMRQMINFIQESEKAGYNMDFFNDLPACLPDGTFSRVYITENGSKLCVDENRQPIDNYLAHPNTEEYESMDCKCARTSRILEASNEKPVCCSNGNFREIQCRRGLCRCVDSNGRQIGIESLDVTTLPCYKDDWRKC